MSCSNQSTAQHNTHRMAISCMHGGMHPCEAARAPVLPLVLRSSKFKQSGVLFFFSVRVYVQGARDAQSCIATTSFAGSPRASTTTFIWVTSTQRSFCAIIAAAFALHAGASSSGQWLPTASPALPRPSASALVLLQYSYVLSQPMHLRYEYEYDTTCKSQK